MLDRSLASLYVGLVQAAMAAVKCEFNSLAMARRSCFMLVLQTLALMVFLSNLLRQSLILEERV